MAPQERSSSKSRGPTLMLIGLLLGTGQCRGAPAPGLVRNVVDDYGAGGGPSPGEISTSLQKAVDELDAAGGGTVVIPSRAGGWTLGRPIFVGSPNVTIAGEGAGTRISGGGTMFLLGLRPQYPEAISAGHFPIISGPGKDLFDASVTGVRQGLRTYDGKVCASGFFPACPLAFGATVPRDPSGDYWKDYERGSGKPTYWQNWPRYTINLAVFNNTAEPMRGVICGTGAGGLSPKSTRGNIDDPLTIWTIESDPATGESLSLKFKTIGMFGEAEIRSLLLSKQPAGKGMHRISVQLDLVSGKCRAWYSASPGHMTLPVLSAKLDLDGPQRMQAFEYGAFQLGRVTGRMFSGSPSPGGTGSGEGDWTYCGVSLLDRPRYDINPDNDQLGAAQKRATDGKAVDDAYRFFPTGDPGLITYLPLAAQDSQTPDILLRYQNGQTSGGVAGYGYWVPERKPELIPGTIALRDIQLFASSANSGMAVAVGEASHAVLENIYEGGGGYHGVSGLPCGATDKQRLLELRNCRLVGSDASLYAIDQTVRSEVLSGGSGETVCRLVGCQGFLDHTLVTGFVACDYYLKLHAGHRGGPMRISEFCIDNEGLTWAPRKACFYAEPSLETEPNSNRLSFPGTIYTGALFSDQAVVELADAPGNLERPPSGNIVIDGVDLMSSEKKRARCIVLSHGTHWSGKIQLAETRWAGMLSEGVVSSTSPGPCGIVSYHDDSDALPSIGSWRAECHVFRLPVRDSSTGSWTFRTYRCVHGGTYGTADEPRWEEVPAKGK